MPDINNLIAEGIRPPQVETLGDAYTRMRANQLAQQEGEQRLTLGDMATAEGRLKLQQATQAAQDDLRGRTELFGDGSPATPAPQAAPATSPQPQGAPAQGVPAAAPQPQQAATPQTATPAGAQPQAPGPRPRPTQAAIFSVYGPVRGAVIVKAMTEADTAGVDLATKKAKLGNDLLDFEGNLASMVKAAGYSPDAVEQAMHMLEDHGYAPEAAQLRAHIAQNPGSVQALMDQAIQASPKQRELTAAATTAEAHRLTAATGAGKQAIEAPGQAAQVAQQVRANAASQLAAAAERGPDAVNVLLNAMEPGLAAQFAGAKTPADFLRKGLTAEQQTTAGQAATNATNTEADRKVTQGQGAAHLRLEGQAQFLRQKTFDLTMTNAKSQGILGVPPHLIGPASAAFEKAGNEYAAASSASDTMQAVLDLAQKGNKAAGSNLPLIGVETLNAINQIKRVNGAEIKQYGSAGDALDALKAKLGKLVLGQPIPQDVLNDIRELHTTVAQQATTTYARKVQVTNNTYGSQFKPVDFGAANAAAPKTVNLRSPDGTVRPVPEDQVEHYLRLGATRAK